MATTQRRNKDGYVVVRQDGRQRYLHVLIAEKALGRRLRPGEEVHHANLVRSDNRNNNLVICDRAYHTLLHLRTSAYRAGYPPAYRQCRRCGRYDDPRRLSGENGSHAVGFDALGAVVCRV